MRPAAGWRYSRRRRRVEFLLEGRRIAWYNFMEWAQGGERLARRQVEMLLQEAGWPSRAAFSVAVAPVRHLPSR